MANKNKKGMKEWNEGNEIKNIYRQLSQKKDNAISGKEIEV